MSYRMVMGSVEATGYSAASTIHRNQETQAGNTGAGERSGVLLSLRTLDRASHTDLIQIESIQMRGASRCMIVTTPSNTTVLATSNALNPTNDGTVGGFGP